MRSNSSLFGAVCAAVLLIVSLKPAAKATPYASGVTVNGGVVTFILNESADNVTVEFDGAASSQDLGALEKGTHTFNMGTATSFDIVVSKDSAPGYTQGILNQISSDTNILNRFSNQRGVAVNKNPNSPLFGRIYVSVSAAGTSGGRSLTEGIYVLNADQSETSLGTNALTAGLDFATGGAESPHRLTIGPDDNLYIGDWSDAGGTLYVADANVANGQNVLPGPRGSGFPITNRLHGSISAAWIEGSLATGDLAVYVIDEDLQTDPNSTAGTERNSVWRWDIGAGPFPAAGPPVKIMSPLIGTASQLADLARGPDGKWYVSQRRAEPANTSGVFVRAPDGTALSPVWASLTKTRELFPGATDLLGETCAVDVSPDGKWMATLRRDTNLIHVLPLIDGVPDMTNRVSVMTLPATGLGRDLGFDAAGNLYYVSSGQGVLRVLSPGGRTTATTHSDGTFGVVTTPVPFVAVTTSDAQGSEDGFDSIAFTFTRNQMNVDQPLTVHYTLTGTAANGSDYPLDAELVTFAPNETTVTLTLEPTDDGEAELTETVVLTIAANTDYAALNPSVASATILDNEPITLRLTSTSKTNMYEPLPTDTVTLRVTRLGSLVGDVFTAELTSSGGATENDDFLLSTNYFPVAPGEVTVLITLTPLNDLQIEGDETAIIALGDGSGDYFIDSQNTVTALLRSDDLPPAPILFAEDFTGNASANWQVRFGANDGVDDFLVNWEYDYGSLGIGPAPKTQDGSTRGLFAAVNTGPANGAANTGGSAGINLYPIGQSFNGDYALRFDMYLSFGTAATTEHALLGINHSGNVVNRATQSTDAGNTTAGGDGFWVGIVSDASNLRDYSGYVYPAPTSLPSMVVNRAASTLTGLITSPPYFLAGSPGSSGSTRSWAEVELMQVNDLITLKVNNVPIWEYQNTDGPTAGNIMIGLNDQFDSAATANHFVVFDNVRVVNLSTDIEITNVQLSGVNELEIDFTSPSGGLPADYSVESTPGLASPSWGPVASTITSLGGNNFRAIVSRSVGEGYYRISKP